MVAGAWLAFATPQPAFAQQGSGGLVNLERDCQSIRSCNFRRGGSYRGCISSYSCRTCRLVAARCTIGGAGNARACREMRCTWGAA